jgi:hypothetical protein
MPAPLLRKKPADKIVSYDPVSAAAWAAGAKATAAVVELIDMLKLNPSYSGTAKALAEQLEAATTLTPCALKKEARTQPARSWTFQDYLLTVRVCEALRGVVVDGVDSIPHGAFGLFDQMREKAANAILDFIAPIEEYRDLVKLERAMERLSGNESLRRLGRRR